MTATARAVAVLPNVMKIPNYPQIGSVYGGRFYVAPVAIPAPTSDITFEVPASGALLLTGFKFDMAVSAAIPNRTAELRVEYGDLILCRIVSAQILAPGASGGWFFCSEFVAETQVNGWTMTPLPFVVCPPTSNIIVEIGGLDSGDLFDTLSLTGVMLPIA